MHLLHVVDAGRLQELRALLPDGAEAQERLLAEAKRLMAEATNALDGPCEKRVEIGSHPAAILAASRGHDLLVLGAHGGHPVREALLGSTADRLLLKAERPTLVVKRAADGPYRRVVIPCEYAPPARRALELALRVAPGARITLLHAFEVEFEGLLWRAAVPSERIAALKAEAAQRAHAWLDKLTDGLEGAEAVGTLADHGSAARVALEVADRVGADLVVMGKQGRAAVGELFLGSVTRRVLAEAKCDVLVAPASREP
jgi:nucleotide-binding universal stress UspA family protein